MGEIQYRTQHREELIKYLRSIKGQHFTVADIHSHFKSSGKPMGTTTIYRQLERLLKEGAVSKYVIDQNTPACFEYIGDDDLGGDEQQCFHCKCESCGRLIHLHCDEMRMIEGHLKEHHHFILNPLRTVLYGLCENCQRDVK